QLFFRAEEARVGAERELRPRPHVLLQICDRPSVDLLEPSDQRGTVRAPHDETALGVLRWFNRIDVRLPQVEEVGQVGVLVRWCERLRCRITRSRLGEERTMRQQTDGEASTSDEQRGNHKCQFPGHTPLLCRRTSDSVSVLRNNPGLSPGCYGC